MSSLPLRLASISLSLAIPAIASAQPASSFPEYPRRVGLELNIGLQGGNLSCSSPNGECNEFMEAGGMDIGATYMFTPRLGINLQAWGMIHSRDGWTQSQVISTLGIEFRPVSFLSLQAGLGGAHASLFPPRQN